MYAHLHPISSTAQTPQKWKWNIIYSTFICLLKEMKGYTDIYKTELERFDYNYYIFSRDINLNILFLFHGKMSSSRPNDHIEEMNSNPTCWAASGSKTYASALGVMEF
jgi:hypothetical protein